MKKNKYWIFVLLNFLLIESIYALNINETFWINLYEKWNLKDQNEETQRIGSAWGQIVFFGDNNRFYYLTGLLELYKGNIVGIDVYEDYTIGFIGRWEQVGNEIEIKYHYYPNQYARRPLNPKFEQEIKQTFFTKIKLKKNYFKLSYLNFGEKLFYHETKYNIKVNGSIVGDYFGKEHTTNRILKVEPKIDLSEKYFSRCNSPDGGKIFVANSINEEMVRFQLVYIPSKTDTEIKMEIFKPLFPKHYIEKPEKIEWSNDKIVFLFKKKEMIFHRNEKLIEIKNISGLKKDYYDYLYLQIDQFYDNLSVEDQVIIFPSIKTYLGLRTEKKFFKRIEKKSQKQKSWEKIGYTFSQVIKQFEDRYKKKLFFQIFKRAFNEHFVLKNDKVIFRWKKD